MTPEQVIKRFMEAEQEAQQQKQRGDYFASSLSIELARFKNEIINPNSTPADLDVIRTRCHDLMDQWLDSVAGVRMVYDKAKKEIDG